MKHPSDASQTKDELTHFLAAPLLVSRMLLAKPEGTRGASALQGSPSLPCVVTEGPWDSVSLSLCSSHSRRLPSVETSGRLSFPVAAAELIPGRYPDELVSCLIFHRPHSCWHGTAAACCPIPLTTRQVRLGMASSPPDVGFWEL